MKPPWCHSAVVIVRYRTFIGLPFGHVEDFSFVPNWIDRVDVKSGTVELKIVLW
jgi:hypothetical protein